MIWHDPFLKYCFQGGGLRLYPGSCGNIRGEGEYVSKTRGPLKWKHFACVSVTFHIPGRLSILLAVPRKL